MEVRCSNCGSIYGVREHNSPVRDKDQINCEVCGVVLLKWNGGVFYTNCKLKQKMTAHLNKRDKD